MIVPKNFKVSSTQGHQLKRAVCKIMTMSDFSGVEIVVWYGAKKSGIDFGKWGGMQGLDEAICRSFLRTSG